MFANDLGTVVGCFGMCLRGPPHASNLDMKSELGFGGLVYKFLAFSEANGLGIYTPPPLSAIRFKGVWGMRSRRGYLGQRGLGKSWVWANVGRKSQGGRLG